MGTSGPGDSHRGAPAPVATFRSGKQADARELILVMQPSATPADVGAVKSALERMIDVLSIRFVGKVEAFEEAYEK